MRKRADRGGRPSWVLMEEQSSEPTKKGGPLPRKRKHVSASSKIQLMSPLLGSVAFR